MMPRLALGPLALARTASAEVLVKILKDMNIGYAHGAGTEAPGTAVKNAPFMIFFGKVPSPADCLTACVADLDCTGFVHTDDKQAQHAYDNTCYFRTDGCHDKSCVSLLFFLFFGGGRGAHDNRRGPGAHRGPAGR